MTDSDVMGQMHDHILRQCQSAGDQMTYNVFSYMLTSMQLWNDEVHPRTQLEDFFKVSQREDIAEPHFFRPNSIDPSKQSLPQFIPTQQFVKAFDFLARKPLNFIYQDIIDKFYVLSKRKNVSMCGPTIMHLFSMDDLEETGLIRLDSFVQRILEFLHNIKVKGAKILLKSEDISAHDLRFLGTRYMDRDGQMMVKYVKFLEDYDAIERQGLGGGANQLSLTEVSVRRDTALQNVQGKAGTWRIKTIHELSPPESKTLYEKMGHYLKKKALIDELCLGLVNEDQARQGYLMKARIGQVICTRGMKISANQLTLLTQVLIMNSKKEHCYLEMISLLAGEQVMQSVIQTNNLEFGRDA